MDTDQINYTIAEMRKWVEETYAEPTHLLTMIPKMEEMARYSPDDQETREKLMRWIGFMQGALWAWGDFTVDDFRAMNTKEL